MAVYALPGVKSNVRLAANEVGNRHNIRTILGVGARPNQSDHPKGLALDFMCDLATGDAVKADLIANWDRYHVKYLIHRQKIKNSKNGPWENMADRGSPTANHMDHVHASFENQAANEANSFTSGDVEIWVDLDGDGLEDTTGRPMSEMPEGKPPVGSSLIPDWAKGIADAFTFLTEPNNWVRLGLVVAGTLFISIVLFQLMKGGLI